MSIQSTAVDLGPDKAAPLFIPGFSFKNIGQSSPFAGLANTISITFAATCAFEVNTVVVIQISANWQTSGTSAVLPVTDRGNAQQTFGGTSSWNVVTKELSLTVRWATRTDLLYAFSIAITNGATAQAAPSISIRAAGSTLTISPTAMVQAQGYDAAFYTVLTPLDSTMACQSSVSWTKATSSAQWAGRRGLGFVGRGGLSLIDSSVPPFSLEAIWIQPTGSLTFFSSALFVAGVQYVARVRLQNPAATQSVPTGYIESPSVGIFREVLVNDLNTPLNFTGSVAGDRAVLKIYDPGQWHSVRIGQSTTFPLAANTLTVTLVSASTLTQGGGSAQVTLTGLAGTAQANSGALPLQLQGSAPSVFQSTGAWAQSGSLVLSFAPGASLLAGQAAIVSFALQNSVGVPSPSGPRDVYAAFSGNLAIPATFAAPDTATVLPLLGAVAGDARPLLVYPPRLIFAAAGQSSALQGADNVVTVTLAANFALTASTRITVSGVLGAFSAFHNSAAWSGMSATWDAQAGAVTVAATQAWAAGAPLVVAFTITNPAAGRAAGTMSAQLADTSTSTSATATVQGAAGFAAPFFVHSTGFLVSSIAQSTPYPAAANLLNVSVQLSADLILPSTGAQLLLQGLTGAPRPWDARARLPCNLPPPPLPLATARARTHKRKHALTCAPQGSIIHTYKGGRGRRTATRPMWFPLVRPPPRTHSMLGTPPHDRWRNSVHKSPVT
jgi:hypothetical protein